MKKEILNNKIEEEKKRIELELKIVKHAIVK